MDLIIYIMMGVLLLAGYFFLLHTVTKRMDGKKSVLMIGIVLFLIYAAVAVPLMYILSQMGSSSFVLLALMLLLACVVLFMALYSLVRNFSDLNKGMLILFILYLLMVGYITLFSRSEGQSRTILLRFDSIRDAIKSKSFEPLQHIFLNALMFIPIGILFPTIRPGHLNRITYVGALGMMFSTMIEATQLFLRMGQCDV